MKPIDFCPLQSLYSKPSGMRKLNKRTKFKDGSEVVELEGGACLIREHRAAQASVVGQQAPYDQPPPPPSGFPTLPPLSPPTHDGRTITPCAEADLPTIYEIINESARAYKGVIAPDRWHDPYMPMTELQSEISNGVRFYGYSFGGRLVGVMGIQDVKDVTLIRHAYVRTQLRGHGIGRELLGHLSQLTRRPVLIGTWKAATWAVRFYQKHGFVLVSDEEKHRLLKTYWTVPDRQIEESVVLADQRWCSFARKSTSHPGTHPLG